MRIRSLGLVIVAFTLASVSLLAHHSFAMFEMDKDVEYRGVVKEWKWQNPHVHFTVNVTKAIQSSASSMPKPAGGRKKYE